MTDVPIATYYADQATQCRVRVVENVRCAADTYRLRVKCPEIARAILPGQFVMLRWVGCDDPILGRPLAMYDVVVDESGNATGCNNDIGLDMVYLVVGRLTGMLAECRPGQSLDVWGPLGNGFPAHSAGRDKPAEHLIIVAGGIGQTPFLTLARERLGTRQYGTPPREVPRVRKVTLCYGARNERWLACVDDFRTAGVRVLLATDDGSTGHHGLVTDVLAQVLDEEENDHRGNTGAAHIVCCGPEPMMAAVAEMAGRRGVSCEVSLETPMACGVGICFSCVTKVREDGKAEAGWDYRRTCVDGPVFDAARVVFDD